MGWITHGLTRNGKIPPCYHIWVMMRQRCNNKRHSAYAIYGGRGIKVDPVWNSYEQFITDMGPRPSLEHTLDRIDNNKGYSKNNCRWATPQEQTRNRNKIITYRGRSIHKLGFSEDSINEILKIGY